MTRKFLILFMLFAASSCSHTLKITDCDLSVLSVNLFAGNTNGSSAAETIAQYEPDIITALELTDDNLDIQILEQAGYYPNVYQPDNSGVNGIAIFSKSDGTGELIPVLVWPAYDIDPVERMPMASYTLSAGRLEIKILAVHIPPPFYYSNDEREQVIDLLLSETGDNTIIAGDFNMFDIDPLFKDIINAGFSDSAGETGNYNATWEGIARIDYIMIPLEFSAAYSGTIAIDGSDHKAVISGIFFN